MATNLQTPSFLTLPIELRNIIYSELLSSRRSIPLMLYSNSKGREALFNFHPSILCSNQQIYAEAVSHLYRDNIFQLDLHTFNHKRPLDLPLFRCDDASHTAVSVGGKYHDRLMKLVIHTNQHTKMYEDCRSGPGPIYSHILRRLAHIELYTGAFAICGGSKDGISITHTGELVLKILQVLAEEEIEEGLVIKKTLKVEVRAKWTPDNLFLGDKGPLLSQEDGRLLRAKMLALLREIKKRRVVEVREAVLDETRGRNEIHNVNIDTGKCLESE
ncbi:MAG: hypothetical protein ALECFALPRED_007799 [Alectoria fallacina]|uniref:Uncharacterized protein n=1 Tax=Alectoria fallacina TaxID=1903189 RepID=A0A8H3IFQ8_9LECA|nr:MAG: hypothetical protein ALECFALPRED_007799 [Alectoria fallacina]